MMSSVRVCIFISVLGDPIKRGKQIIFPVKCENIAYYFRFRSAKDFAEAKKAAAAFGLTIEEFTFRGSWVARKPKDKSRRSFTFADIDKSTLRVKLVQCDDFTKMALERQVKCSIDFGQTTVL
jgi:hypothetical protein